jgi:hypothetical protein
LLIRLKVWESWARRSFS